MNPSRRIVAATALFLVAFGSSAIAGSTTINFDSLAPGTVVTTQFQGVTFSSSPGFAVRVFAAQEGTSQPNLICAGTGSNICSSDIFVDFNTPVTNVKFLASAFNSPSGAAVRQVQVFNGLNLLGTVSIVSTGAFAFPRLIDLSGFGSITRIAIVFDTDPAGLTFDDFTFDNCSGSPLDLDKVTALLILEEGNRSVVYDDKTGGPWVGGPHKGHPTIGIGFNLDRSDAKKTLKMFGLDYKAILDGSELTPAQVTALFQHDLANTIATATDIVGAEAYASLPEPAKEALIDMTFNLNHKLIKFKDFLRSLRQGNLEAAAAAFVDSAFCVQVGPARCDRIRDLLLECADQTLHE
jgi:GH24 family phage-related lysozyme (muramidase)